MSEFLSLRELQKVFSLPTAQAIKAAYENSGGNSVTILDNVTLAALIEEAVFAASVSRKTQQQIDVLKADQTLAPSLRRIEQRLDRIEAALPETPNLKRLEMRINQLEMQQA